MMTGTLHRLIFAFTVGMVALVISTIFCIVSSPMHAWRVSEWLSKKAIPAKPDEKQVTAALNELGVIAPHQLLTYISLFNYQGLLKLKLKLKEDRSLLLTTFMYCLVRR